MSREMNPSIGQQLTAIIATEYAVIIRFGTCFGTELPRESRDHDSPTFVAFPFVDIVLYSTKGIIESTLGGFEPPPGGDGVFLAVWTIFLGALNWSVGLSANFAFFGF